MMIVSGGAAPQIGLDEAPTMALRGHLPLDFYE
jgi:hypothetical protein